MTAPRVEKAYEKYAWIILFAVGTFGFIGNLALTLIGPSVDPDLQPIAGVTWDELSSANPRVASWIDYIYRSVSGNAVLASFFMMAISLKSYRRGEKWSWYALWSFPVFLGLGLFPYSLSVGASGATIYLYTVVLIVFLLGLLLPYRKFFPRK